GDQRLLHLDALRFGQEILVQIAAVHLELAAAGTQENPGHARLAASRAVILNLISHRLFSTPSVLGPLKPAWPKPASQASVPDECAYRLCKPSASCPWTGPACSWAACPGSLPAPPVPACGQSACGNPLRAARRGNRCSDGRPSARTS